MDSLTSRHRTPSQAGFTLVELMITVSLIAIGALSLALAQLQALADGNRARHRTNAATIARDQMEFVQGMGFSEPALAAMDSTNFVTPPWLDNAADPALAAGEVPLRVDRPGGAVDEIVYTVYYRVAADDATLPNPALRFVDLEVIWNERGISNVKPTRTGQPTVAISSLLVENDR